MNLRLYGGWSFRRAFSSYGWLVALAVAVLALVFAAYVVNPVEEAGDAIGFSPDSPLVATTLCGKPETVITLINQPQDRYYTAIWEEPGLRYDLTWRADGTSIAVEKMRGRDFDVWAEQVSTDFLTCVTSRPFCLPEATPAALPSTCVRVKEAIH